MNVNIQERYDCHVIEDLHQQLHFEMQNMNRIMIGHVIALILIVFFTLFSLPGVQLLALLVPIQISLLVPSNILPSTSKQSRALHEFALQRLMKIGPLYPLAFKTVMGAAPELKTKLEGAVKASQMSANRAKEASRIASRPVAPAAPSIKLKTNFSNFTG